MDNICGSSFSLDKPSMFSMMRCNMMSNPMSDQRQIHNTMMMDMMMMMMMKMKIPDMGNQPKLHRMMRMDMPDMGNQPKLHRMMRMNPMMVNQPKLYHKIDMPMMDHQPFFNYCLNNPNDPLCTPNNDQNIVTMMMEMPMPMGPQRPMFPMMGDNPPPMGPQRPIFPPGGKPPPTPIPKMGPMKPPPMPPVMHPQPPVFPPSPKPVHPVMPMKPNPYQGFMPPTFPKGYKFNPIQTGMLPKIAIGSGGQGGVGGPGGLGSIGQGGLGGVDFGGTLPYGNVAVIVDSQGHLTVVVDVAGQGPKGPNRGFDTAPIGGVGPVGGFGAGGPGTF